jgi:hypothetical protein
MANPVSVGHVGVAIGDKWLQLYDAPCASLDVMAGPGSVLLNFYGSALRHSDAHSFENNYETGVGIGRIWSLGTFHPRLSGGFARAWLKGRTRRDVDNDVETRFQAWGSRGWIAIGGYWPVGVGPTLGLTARFSEIGHHDYPQLGGTYVGATLGWAWGFKKDQAQDGRVSD